MTAPRRVRIAALAALGVLASACDDDRGPAAGSAAEPAAPDPVTAAAAPPVRPFRFTDVTATSGLDLATTSGTVPATQILEVKGGGLGLVDHDGDGDLDVFVPNGATLDDPEHGPGWRLYENLGAMTFRDATAGAGLAQRRWAMGVAVGDYDGDGRDDLYVTCYGPNVLLRSTGDGRFEDVTRRAGVGDARWSTAAAFGDLDGDGDLDLYVANYLRFDAGDPPPPSTFKGVPVLAGPHGLPPEGDALFENLGDGTFRDVTSRTAAGSVAPAFGLGVVILDFDDDGRQDVLVGNDSMANFLFMNRGDLRFEEVGRRSGIAASGDGSSQASMGLAVADVDGNGRPDLFSTNFSNETNTLHLNQDGRFFNDETRRYGLGMISFPYLGWACGFHDLDHDGDEDLLLFNGHVFPNATRETMDSDVRQPPLLFARNGTRFEAVTAATAGPWLAEAHCDRSAAFGDLDGDGDVDVVVGELNGPVRVLRNDGAGPGWLVVVLAGPALGSRVELTAGEHTQRRWIHGGGSFLSASAPRAHFGLPASVDRVDLLVVRADGTRQRLEDVTVDQYVIVPAP